MGGLAYRNGEYPFFLIVAIIVFRLFKHPRIIFNTADLPCEFLRPGYGLNRKQLVFRFGNSNREHIARMDRGQR